MKRWCFDKGVYCTHATESGFCSLSACKKFGLSSTIGDFQKLQQENTLPDELIINGIKYRRVEE